MKNFKIYSLILVSAMLLSSLSFAGSNWVPCPQLSWFEGSQLRVGDSVVDNYYPMHPITWKLEQLVDKASNAPQDSIPNATPELSSWTYDLTERTIEKQNTTDKLICRGWINVEDKNIYTFTISAMAKDYSYCVVNRDYTFDCY